MTGSLEGRTALITGSTRGIGHAVARLLTAEGARVVVNGRRQADVDAAAASIEGAVGVVGEVGDAEQVAALCAAAVAQVGPIDIIVNNAGASVHRQFLDGTDEDWEHLLAVNLHGPRRVVRELLPAMRERAWGRIVNVISEAAVKGTPGYSSYASSKGALLAFSLTLAAELEGDGIRVNAFAPLALTDMVRSQVSEGFLASMIERGFPTVEECAQTMLPLVLDDAPNGNTVVMHFGEQSVEFRTP